MLSIESMEEVGIKVKTTPVAETSGWITKALRGVSEGQRDDICTKLAGFFHSRNIPEDVTRTILETFGANCDPPLDKKSLNKCVSSVFKYQHDEVEVYY